MSEQQVNFTLQEVAQMLGNKDLQIAALEKEIFALRELVATLNKQANGDQKPNS